MNSFIMAHLAVTQRGLWVLPSGLAATNPTPEDGETVADAKARLGANYKVLLANDGMYVYDGYGVQVAKYGEVIDFSGDRQWHIGSDDAYILYKPATAATPAKLIIGGANVQIGTGGKTLDEMLAELAKVEYDHEYSYASGTYTFTAKAYRGYDEISAQYDPDFFVWYLRTETGDTFLGSGYTMQISAEQAGYRGSIIGGMEDVLIVELVDDQDATITDSSGNSIMTHAIWEV